MRGREILVPGGGADSWGRSGCAQGAPRSANGQREEHTAAQNAGATPGGTRASAANKEKVGSEAGEAARIAGTGNQKVEEGEHAHGGATTHGMAS